MTNIEGSFSWDRMSICFPEWFLIPGTNDKDEGYVRIFPKAPLFTNGKIDFLFENEYGVQIFLENSIPDWITKTAADRICAPVKKIYDDFTKSWF